MKIFKIIFIFIFLSGCSESTEGLEPGDRVLLFLESADYEMLSNADRSVWSQEEWEEHTKSGIIPKPSLLATNKYFELEQYLYSISTIKIKKVEEQKDRSHSVFLEFRWPRVLGEVYYFDSSFMEYVEEELENLFSAYKTGQLTPETVKYSETIEEYLVLPSGIFFNVEEIKYSKDKRNRVKELLGELDYIDDYDLEFDFYSLGSSNLVGQVKKLREIGINQIQSDISLLESAIHKSDDLDTGTSFYSELITLSKLYRARLMLKSDVIYKNALEFSKIKVAESRGSRGFGLFFDWKINSDNLPDQNVSAGFQAKYFDDSNDQIGSEIFLISSINTENGNRGGSIGRVIENQGSARRISSVRVEYLVPSRVPRFNCDFDGKIKCLLQ